MNEKELKSMIESILSQMMDSPKEAAATQEVVSQEMVTQAIAASAQQLQEESMISDECLDDITEIDIKGQLLIPDPEDREGYLKMKERTPARLGIWRAGPRYKTSTSLRFRADHAAAQDAVFSYVPEEFVKEMNLVSIATLCKDKDEYITRPDLGRQLSSETIQYVKQNTTQFAKVQLVVGDGLSSAAIEANLRDILPSITQGLKMYGIELGNILFVKHCRVPSMDVIGDITGADVVCLLVGERPGLVTAESMSAYVAYKPTVGMPEAKRTVISNIHQGGTPAVEAGAHIAELIKTMIEKKASGIDLKL
ncbi:ethanolamine ammonia-lyase subunit EutC [Brevibacillus laterosporus]|uniref:Ethanolamine ammonia-lyase small subunit n=2 Tax=Brevibacillus TaxID=55080 RepID=A0A075R568_BRELA|nr:ethanolamine ammonia-lyase subunit EutC [Brevibacillus laterosporus]MCZ0834821.1 ethanolamine ammonia-lyase subunit EutC [Brevibacillus halotolerans]AIG26999.1 ethanolamine ammonia-lyase light chain [Brevibacillus laterosporus LMG 15441]AUM65416.1 ethanolamine ammonia-lyase subunit EutC [Brevibacillus laterosporus]AYK08420.1 ethanolamine ammonia-lyase subunit EutC [Brevibacillus laterosporus]ERM15968.1 ethanolamine ammonia-lyase small subunit [Brevibacillus laterosporus PE36]